MFGAIESTLVTPVGSFITTHELGRITDNIFARSRGRSDDGSLELRPGKNFGLQTFNTRQGEDAGCPAAAGLTRGYSHAAQLLWGGPMSTLEASGRPQQPPSPSSSTDTPPLRVQDTRHELDRAPGPTISKSFSLSIRPCCYHQKLDFLFSPKSTLMFGPFLGGPDLPR